MAWLLIIQVVMVATCSEGFQFCPPAKPPAISQRAVRSEGECRALAARYRQAFPARREMVRGEHMRMEQVSTVECRPQVKG